MVVSILHPLGRRAEDDMTDDPTSISGGTRGAASEHIGAVTAYAQAEATLRIAQERLSACVRAGDEPGAASAYEAWEAAGELLEHFRQEWRAAFGREVDRQYALLAGPGADVEQAGAALRRAGEV